MLRRLAFAPVILVLAVAGCATTPIPPRPAVPDASQQASAAPGSDAPATISPNGMQVRSVQDAIEIRDAGEDDRELTVQGFLSPDPALSCPFVPAEPNPARIDCPASFQWLMADPEIVLTVGPSSASGGPPTGPAIHPSFALVQAPTVPIPPSGAVAPMAVTLVGHFDDRRASLCPVDPTPAIPCQDTFVVDQVAVIGAQQQAIQTAEDLATDTGRLQPKLTVDDVDRLSAGADPDAVMLSRRVSVAKLLVNVEPALRGSGLAQHDDSAVWQVVAVDGHAAEPRHARTFLIEDATEAVFEMSSDGPRQIAGPVASLAPASPTATMLPSGTTVTVVPALEPVIGVRDDDPTAARPWSVAAGPWLGQLAAGDSFDELAIRWTGVDCGRWFVTVDLAISIRQGPIRSVGPSNGTQTITVCDGVPRPHAIVVTFDRTVDPATFRFAST